MAVPFIYNPPFSVGDAVRTQPAFYHKPPQHLHIFSSLKVPVIPGFGYE